MKEKVFIVCQTKVFRDESYGDPELTLCKTQEIAHREFLSLVESELDEYIDEDDINCLNDELFDNGELKEGDILTTPEHVGLYIEGGSQNAKGFDAGNGDRLLPLGLAAKAYLDGDEFTVSVLDGMALPVIQICPHSGQYDYHSKYTKGATDYIVPAPISDELALQMKYAAEQGYKVAECKGAVRFDFKADKEGRPFILEANSIPGMTSTSLVPKAAAAAGISFSSLCEKILLEAGLGKV